jgi:nicotinamide-nucleotide amidase
MKRNAVRLIKLLSEKKLRLALAESMTCGLTSNLLARVKGTSEVFWGSVICYNKEVKEKLFKIPLSVLEKHTAESKVVTELLAKNLSRIIAADIYAAITGLAADGGSEEKSKPVGTVYFSVRFRKKIYSQKKLFRGSPTEIMKKASEELFQFIIQVVKKKSGK